MSRLASIARSEAADLSHQKKTHCRPRSGSAWPLSCAPRCEPDTVRHGCIALFSRASCVRGMSAGLARRTLSTEEHDTKTTNKANESSRLPAFSFRCRGMADTQQGALRAADGEMNLRCALTRGHASKRRARQILSLYQFDVADRLEQNDCRRASQPTAAPLPRLTFRDTLSCLQRRVARHFCGSWATTQDPRHSRDRNGRLKARRARSSPWRPSRASLRRQEACRRLGRAIPQSAWQAPRHARSTRLRRIGALS